VQCTLLQTLFGRGSVTLLTSDRSTPTVVLRAIPNPIGVADMLRAHVQRCRVANGVREFDGQSRTASVLTMNAVTDPLALQDATWYGASPVLDTLLVACERPSGEVTPAQRLTRQYAAMNAMRL